MPDFASQLEEEEQRLNKRTYSITEEAPVAPSVLPEISESSREVEKLPVTPQNVMEAFTKAEESGDIEGAKAMAELYQTLAAPKEGEVEKEKEPGLIAQALAPLINYDPAVAIAPVVRGLGQASVNTLDLIFKGLDSIKVGGPETSLEDRDLSKMSSLRGSFPDTVEGLEDWLKQAREYYKSPEGQPFSDAIVEDLTQATAGFLTAGGFIKTGGVIGSLAKEGVGVLIAFAGEDQNIVDVAKEFGIESPLITEYLQTEEDDPELVGRLKNVIADVVGIGVSLEVVFSIFRAAKSLRKGKSAEKVVKDAQETIVDAALDAIESDAVKVSREEAESLLTTPRVARVEEDTLENSFKIMDSAAEKEAWKWGEVAPSIKSTPDTFVWKDKTGTTPPKVRAAVAEPRDLTRLGREIVQISERPIPRTFVQLRATFDPILTQMNKAISDAPDEFLELLSDTFNTAESNLTSQAIIRITSDLDVKFTDAGEALEAARKADANAKTIYDLSEELNDLGDLRDKAVNINKQLGAFQGSALQLRQIRIDGVGAGARKLTAKALRANRNWTNEQVAAYLKELRNLPLENSLTGVPEFKAKMFRAIRSGDTTKAKEYSDKIKEILAKEQGAFQRVIVNRFNKMLAYINEYYVNSLLSGPNTHYVNSISGALNQILAPAQEFGASYFSRSPWAMKNKATRIAAARQYHVMWQSKSEAFEHAKLAFKTENSKISTEQRFAEGHTRIPGTLGKLIRLPGVRLMMLTDEFLQQLIYRAEVTADATIEFYTRAGGKPNKRLLKAHIEKELKASFNKDGFAINSKAIRSTENRLFKEAFSPDNGIDSFSKGTEKFYKSIENVFNMVPGLKLIQPFIRTPLRVIQEGVRYLPGNILDDQVRDVVFNGGKNLSEREIARVKAKQIMGASAMGMWGVMASNGMVTGNGGGRDWRIGRIGEDGKKWPGDYMINLYGDQWFSYGRYEPFSIPLKIIANVIERIDNAKFYNAQNVAANEHAKAFGKPFLSNTEVDELDTVQENTLLVMGSVLMGTMEAVTESSFLDGVERVMKIVKSVNSEEFSKTAKKELSKIAGGFVPRPVKIVADLIDDRKVEALNPVDNFLAGIPGQKGPLNKQYTVLGRVRTIPNKWEGMAIILGRKIDPEPKDKADYVEQRIAEMAKELDSNFQMRVTNEDFGGEDLRKLKVPDGSKSYMDAWIQELNTLKSPTSKRTMTERLFDLFRQNVKEGYGFKGSPSGFTDAVRGIINGYRKKAWDNVMKRYSEDTRLIKAQTQARNKDALGKAGGKSLPQQSLEFQQIQQVFDNLQKGNN